MKDKEQIKIIGDHHFSTSIKIPLHQKYYHLG
jgi:hypothetical protein